MSSRKGFTLIELLVVISIITILAGMSIVGIISALRTSDEKVCEMMIQDIASALQQFQMNNGGTYPSTRLEDYNQDIVLDDYTNCGIETCLLLLRSEMFNSEFPIESYQDRLANTDEDENQNAYEFFQVPGTIYKLYELVDPWGNPLVYIPEGEYENEFEYLDLDGEPVMVMAQPLAKTGTYPQGYMIWSFGPDGINQNGKGDDITSWKKSEEDKLNPDEPGYDDDEGDHGTESGEEDDGPIIDD